MKRPNVVFIMADQLKATALRMYSEHGIEAPALERIASEGVTFQTAITPHPLCVPARTSVMTSRYPHSTGCRRNETLMPEGELHAYRIWKEAGFATGLIGKNHCFVEQSDFDLIDVRCEMSHRGLPQGDYIGENVGNTGMEWVVPEQIINESHSTRVNMPRQSPTISYAVTDHPIEGYSSSAITTQAEEFLERHSAPDSKPFALTISYPDPHEPYEVPRKYADMFPPDDVVLPPKRAGEFTDGTAPERNRVLHEILRQDDDTDDDRRGLIATYQAMIRFMDDGIGRILDKLDELGLRENTIVAFTSDHGDFIGEHNMGAKGGVFYDCLVRVPLIVSWPGGGVPQSVVDDSIVNTIDILPTLLQLQGIADFTSPPVAVGELELPAAGPKVPTVLDGDVINSENLRRLHGSPLPTVTDTQLRDAAFSEYGTGGPAFTMDMLERYDRPYGFARLIDTLWAREAEGRRRMVRTHRWKYVTDPMAVSKGDTMPSGADTEDELYDLENDPWELYNVAQVADNATVISEMRSKLVEWMSQTEDARPVPLPRTIGRAPV